jgi:hypothetical protein
MARGGGRRRRVKRKSTELRRRHFVGGAGRPRGHRDKGAYLASQRAPWVSGFYRNGGDNGGLIDRDIYGLTVWQPNWRRPRYSLRSVARASP